MNLTGQYLELLRLAVLVLVTLVFAIGYFRFYRAKLLKSPRFKSLLLSCLGVVAAVSFVGRPIIGFSGVISIAGCCLLVLIFFRFIRLIETLDKADLPKKE